MISINNNEVIYNPIPDITKKLVDACGGTISNIYSSSSAPHVWSPTVTDIFGNVAWQIWGYGDSDRNVFTPSSTADNKLEDQTDFTLSFWIYYVVDEGFLFSWPNGAIYADTNTINCYFYAPNNSTYERVTIPFYQRMWVHYSICFHNKKYYVSNSKSDYVVTTQDYESQSNTIMDKNNFGTQYSAINGNIGGIIYNDGGGMYVTDFVIIRNKALWTEPGAHHAPTRYLGMPNFSVKSKMINRVYIQ